MDDCIVGTSSAADRAISRNPGGASLEEPATLNSQQEALLRALPDGDEVIMAIDNLQDETHCKSPLLSFPNRHPGFLKNCHFSFQPLYPRS